MLITNLNKVRGLSRSERRLLFHAVLLLPVMQIGLLVLGYLRLRRLMERLAPVSPIEGPASEANRIQRAGEIARMVSIAAEHGLYQATCLRRSLAVWWFLRREGIESKICFGARLRDRRLEAHAWVEYNGVVVNDSVNIRAQYQALYGALPATELGL